MDFHDLVFDILEVRSLASLDNLLEESTELIATAYEQSTALMKQVSDLTSSFAEGYQANLYLHGLPHHLSEIRQEKFLKLHEDLGELTSNLSSRIGFFSSCLSYLHPSSSAMSRHVDVTFMIQKEPVVSGNLPLLSLYSKADITRIVKDKIDSYKDLSEAIERFEQFKVDIANF